MRRRALGQAGGLSTSSRLGRSWSSRTGSGRRAFGAPAAAASPIAFMMVSRAAVGYKLTVRPTPSPIRSDQAGWAALVSSSDEDTKPELSPSTQNYDTDSWPLFEPTALALASTARSRQDDVVFDNSRQPNFSFWLQADIQSPKIDFCFTPNNGHSEAHAGFPVLTRI